LLGAFPHPARPWRTNRIPGRPEGYHILAANPQVEQRFAINNFYFLWKTPVEDFLVSIWPDVYALSGDIPYRKCLGDSASTDGEEEGFSIRSIASSIISFAVFGLRTGSS